jgi:hypothetical protein
MPLSTQYVEMLQLQSQGKATQTDEADYASESFRISVYNVHLDRQPEERL